MLERHGVLMVMIINSCLQLSTKGKKEVGGGRKTVHEKLKQRRRKEKSMSMSGQWQFVI